MLKLLPDRGYVVRTAWLYGCTAQLRQDDAAAGGERDPVSVVDDQRGQPTWSRDLAQQIVALVDSGAPAGTYHGTDSGETTWFGFTREIFRLIGADPAAGAAHDHRRIPPTGPSTGLQRAGARPVGPGGAGPMRDWREALAEALPLIRRTDSESPELSLR